GTSPISRDASGAGRSLAVRPAGVFRVGARHQVGVRFRDRQPVAPAPLLLRDEQVRVVDLFWLLLVGERPVDALTAGDQQQESQPDAAMHVRSVPWGGNRESFPEGPATIYRPSLYAPARRVGNFYCRDCRRAAGTARPARSPLEEPRTE